MSESVSNLEVSWEDDEVGEVPKLDRARMGRMIAGGKRENEQESPPYISGSTVWKLIEP